MLAILGATLEDREFRRETTLNIEKTFTEDHQVNLKVTIEDARLEEAKHRAARKLAQRNRIPGFRPGKAPYHVILRTVGDAAVLQEAMDIILDEDYSKIIEEAEIKPYSSGTLNNISSTEPLTLEFTIPLEAEVKLGEYKGLRFPYELAPTTDEDVTRYLEDLRERMSSLEPVDRPAETGDVVFLKLNAERKEAEEGKSLVLIADRATQITIKEEDADNSSEWPFPGFSRRLVGATPGVEDSFEYTYTEDSVMENLRGVAAIFRYKVEDVKIRQLPELNDEFAKTMGEFESIEALRDEVRKGLESQAKSEYERGYQDKIIDAILETSELKYAPPMIERELDLFIHQLEHRLEDQGLDMPTYLKARQLDEAGLRDELREPAEARLRRSLILFEIARTENVKVSENDIQQEAMQTINTINQTYSPKEARKMINETFVQNMISNITSDMLVTKTLERIIQIGRGEAEEVAAPEASEPDSPAAEATPENS